MDDARGLHLPERRLFRIVFTGKAGGEVSAVKVRIAPAGPFGAGRCNAGLIGSVKTQRVDKTVPVVVRQVHDLAISDLAVLLREPYVAFGVEALGLLIVDDAIGLERRVSVINLDIANGGDATVGVVVINLFRLNEHLLLAGLLALERNLGFLRRRRALRELQLLSGCGNRRNQSAKSQQADDGSKFCDATAKRP